ncbi:FkbM family methyltransferase [Aeromicrobium sp.]|uniref:FkbM family methyltransferase n=1 Tax=Aeromicrobium sp. TaxID=1871063 RepID=UPI00198BC831|nr:FkbM family methyltransferase [Aeromicrobium sp.]MBC7630442.1 FkbM family methyltransferase [Aeromicrobium sp.]
MRFDVPADQDVPFVLVPLLTGGYYEEGMLSHIRALRRRGDYVDVGAHVGTHSLWFALQCNATQVYSFEPVGRFADRLRKNIDLNGAADRVTVVQRGLSDAAGTASNVLSESHQVGFMAVPSEQTETFEVCRLDDVLTNRVAVIKLDVEGMEPAVLRGARGILRRDSPAIFAEARNEAERLALFTELLEQGYGWTGRIFNATPTYEFRRPTSRAEAWVWRLRASRSVLGSA